MRPFWPACVAFLLLVVVPANAVADQAGPPDPPGIMIDAPNQAQVGELIRLRATGDATAWSWIVVPPTPDFEAIADRAFLSARGPGQFTIVLAFATTDGVDQVIHVVTIGDTPHPPGSNITAAMVRTWLNEVPEAVRTAMIEDPVTGEKYTRQQAVGRTFADISTAAGKLGSIRATNVMRTTGLKAAFGPEAKQWEPFATAIDAALAAEEKRGVSPAEYGEVLAIIGRALR